MTVNKISLASAWVGLTLAVTVLLPQHAFAQDALSAQNSGVLMDRIDRLERDIRTLNQQIARNPGATASSVNSPIAASGSQPPVQFNENDGTLSRVMVRLDALESEVRAATGQSESLSFRIDQLAQNLDKLMVDLDYRLARLEGGSPASAAPTPSAAPPTLGVSKEGAMPPIEDQAVAVGDGTVSKDGTFVPANKDANVLGVLSKSKLDAIVDKDSQAASTAEQAAASPSSSSSPALPEGSVQDQYRFAFDLTRQARYDEAEVAFKAFLDAHGKDDLANNARYWLAETYYVRTRFKEAAQAFFESYQNAPKGPKAADSLLKLGMSMAGLEKTSEACATFGKLRKEFSPLKPELEQALDREVKRAGCK